MEEAACNLNHVQDGNYDSAKSLKHGVPEEKLDCLFSKLEILVKSETENLLKIEGLVRSEAENVLKIEELVRSKRTAENRIIVVEKQLKETEEKLRDILSKIEKVYFGNVDLSCLDAIFQNSSGPMTSSISEPVSILPSPPKNNLKNTKIGEGVLPNAYEVNAKTSKLPSIRSISQHGKGKKPRGKKDVIMQQNIFNCSISSISSVSSCDSANRSKIVETPKSIEFSKFTNFNVSDLSRSVQKTPQPFPITPEIKQFCHICRLVDSRTKKLEGHSGRHLYRTPKRKRFLRNGYYSRRQSI